MCAEGNPFRCHRLLVADAFLLFLYALIGFFAPLPYPYIVALVAAALLLLGTMVF